MIRKILLSIKALPSAVDRMLFFFNEKKFYKSKYEDLCDSHQKVHSQLYDVQQELRKNEGILYNLKWLLGETKGGRTKLDKTKIGENVLILDWGNNGDLYIEVYPYERGVRKAAYIMASIRKGDRIFIYDFQSSIVNEGHGTVAMNRLLQIAVDNKVSVITGEISDVDNDHWERLEYFYRKMGFDVDFKNRSLVRKMGHSVT